MLIATARSGTPISGKSWEKAMNEKTTPETVAPAKPRSQFTVKNVE